MLVDRNGHDGFLGETGRCWSQPSEKRRHEFEVDAVVRTLDGFETFDLAVPLQQETPVTPHMAPFRMAYARRHGDVIREEGLSSATELISMGAHSGTHIDALAHISVNGKLHGGVEVAKAFANGRFTDHGIDKLPPMVGRGVLFDMPRLAGVDSLPAAHPISARDLEDASDRLGIEVRADDAVLIRTGAGKPRSTRNRTPTWVGTQVCLARTRAPRAGSPSAACG